MGQRAKEIAERLTALNNDLIAFIEGCSDDDWKKVCPGEGWSVGVTAHHIGGHYRAIGLAKMIVAGDTLPDINNEAIDKDNAKHAEDHADCTKDEVLGILKEGGASTADYIGGSSDEDLDRKGHLAAVGGDVSTQQLIEYIIFQSTGEHITNMKAAVGA